MKAIMRCLLITGIALVTVGITSAKADYTYETYYSGTARSAYPPGCVTVPLRQLSLYGDNVFLAGDVTTDLKRVSGGPSPARIRIFRVACAEPDRSVILVQFSFAGNARDVPLPYVVGRAGLSGGRDLPFQLKPEPNTHGQLNNQQFTSQLTFSDYGNGWITEQADADSWLFVLDVNPKVNDWEGPEVIYYYNSNFHLGIQTRTGTLWVEMPSTRSVLAPNPVLPINGRLSGNWIEPGTRDQGFLLSVSTPVPPTVGNASPEHANLLAFLAWYSFDNSGGMLWLTASGLVPQGSDLVYLEFVRVEGGSFMGAQQAQRTIVGSGRLQARNCNLLELDYDLNSLGLGAGTISLTRVFELEIAGYNCRDYPARLESLYGSQGD